MQPIIFHIPHASTVIPADAGFSASAETVAEEVHIRTDHHTDTIYGGLVEEGDAAIIAPVSRIVVDVERFPDDAQEPMSVHGLGAVYTHGRDRRVLRESLVNREALMQRYYYPHHRKLEAAVEHQIRLKGRAAILDCHSFSEHVRPYEPQGALEPRPEICIGTDAFHTPAGMAEALERVYAEHGYSVARNTPYSGAIVPMSAYGKDRRVSSVMIELRRDLYMDERTGGLNSDTSRVVAATRDAVAALRAFFS